MEKGNPPTLLVGKVNWYSHYASKTVWGFLRKLKIELPHDSAIPLQGIYLEKIKTPIQKITCTPVFTAALFTTAKQGSNLQVHQQVAG